MDVEIEDEEWFGEKLKFEGEAVISFVYYGYDFELDGDLDGDLNADGDIEMLLDFESGSVEIQGALDDADTIDGDYRSASVDAHIELERD